MKQTSEPKQFDQIELAIFSGRLNAICEEMGFVLKRTAISPNIKDRLDFSCAFFDPEGRFCAQAAHIPVHLGSMAYAMQDIVGVTDWSEGDVLVLNDPFLGGTHLPDVTVVTPFFMDGVLQGFFANRAHHANIGSSTPGSMPISKSISEEGVLISPCKLFEAGCLVQDTVEMIAYIDCDESAQGIPGDFLAQVSANKAGISRLQEWLSEIEGSQAYLEQGLGALNDYGSQLALKALNKLPEGSAEFVDFMDSDGFGASDIPIKLKLTVARGKLRFDFTGTHHQVEGNLNCPMSVSAASVYYVVLCLLPGYTPHCHGVFDSIELFAPEGCLLNAQSGAAVAAGNVETSMRIVDVVLGAFGQLGVEVPAASQGTMNNIAFGGRGSDPWDYYETIGGGMGASAHYPGLSATQCHLTNSLNTPVESLEMHYPLQIEEYSVRENSGGSGLHCGGDGIIRSYRFLDEASVTLITERRQRAPWGERGGADASLGENIFNGSRAAEKSAMDVSSGDVLTIKTPGGGGWGAGPLNNDK